MRSHLSGFQYSTPNHMLFSSWYINDIVSVLWAETSSIEVKGYIPLYLDDATLQKHIYTMCGGILFRKSIFGKNKCPKRNTIPRRRKSLGTSNCFIRVEIHDSSPNGIRKFGDQESGTCTAGKWVGGTLCKKDRECRVSPLALRCFRSFETRSF